MDDSYSIIKDILSINNVNMVIDIKNKIDDIIQLINDNNKNKTAINLLKQIKLTVNSIIKNINENSDKLNILLKNIDNINNKINLY